MQIKQAGLKAFFWVTNSQLAQVIAGIILLPFMVKKLSPSDIGIWYLFFSFYYLYQLLDFGFSPTFIRKINHQLVHGLENTEDRNQLMTIIGSAKAYYQKLSLALGVIIFVFGSLYIWFSFNEVQTFWTILTWVLFFLSLALNFYFNYQSVILQGFGKVEAVGFAQSVSRFLTIFLSIIGLQYGHGLISLGISYLVGTISLRIMLNHKSKALIKEYSISEIKVVSNFRSLMDKEAIRLGVSSISSFLINRSGTFFISSIVGLTANASFSISLQFFQLISSISLIPFQINLPYFNFQRKKSAADIYKEFYKSLSFCIFLYLIGNIFFFSLGDYIFKLLGFKFILLSRDSLILIAIMTGLELNHVIHATFLTTKGTVPFATAAAASAILIMLFSFIMTPLYGVLGVLATRAIIQLLYNNWKWPVVVFHDMKSNAV